MTLRIFSIQHDRQGLSEVERVSGHIPGITERLQSFPDVNGAVVLGTCNRVEVMLETAADVPNHCLRALLNEGIDEQPSWDLFLGEAALAHVFRVAAGLDSMVVGEREIAGQLRRALMDAQDSGRCSLPLGIAVEEALKTSRRIARETSLEGAGRSVVNTGLDIINLPDWPSARVTIVGTGSYAGAVVAALRARGVRDIAVHSASGRGAEFAASHHTSHSPCLASALNGADLVVTCRGLGSTEVTVDDVAPGMRLLDLSLQHDVDPRVGSLPGVTLVDLAAIQGAVGPGYAEDSERAETLVRAGVAATMARLRARVVDPAVVSLRDTVLAMVDDEVARLPQRQLTKEDAALALRRLATRLLHIPSSRARQAAELGRTDEYLSAMAELYGIGDEPAVDPDELETGRCPVTDMKICDLDSTTTREAM
ncbi:glutamyl-tRNA reductase [Aestuariimicrobium ganziense]|uniref:glutamyl-tRNA reductase n=1 Tax=Aestuariimicrobium ganziense TaxID=2773677 RepID=UPI001944CEF4|nr:glutamyl-tRNA reductase [Aestuariimicrobium ganziense]